MSTYSERDFTPILAAAAAWAQQCLVRDGTILGGGAVWTAQNFADLDQYFVNQPDAGSGDFYQKLEGQMANAPSGAPKLMAELLWLLFLFPSNMGPQSKRTGVEQAWNMSGERLDPDHPRLSDGVLAGIGSAGTAFNTLRWKEVNYAISLFTAIKRMPADERAALVGDYDRLTDWLETMPRDGDRQFRHMLRYLLYPDRVERMSSNGDRRRVLAAFGVATARDMTPWTDREFDDALLALRRRLEVEIGTPEIDFYLPPLVDRWRESELSKEKSTAFAMFDLGYAELRERFLAQFAGFASFASDPDYLEHERRYKDELVQLFEQGVSPLLAKADWPAAGSAAIDLLTRTLKYASNKPQNIVGWRYVDVLRKLGPEQRAAFGRALNDLLDPVAPIEQRVDGFVEQLSRIVGNGQRVLPAAQRSIIGFYLTLVDPRHHLFLKTAELQRALRRLDPGFSWSSGRLTGEDVVRVQSLAARVFERLEAEQWEPEDFLDVQGFLWVATAYGSSSVEEDSEEKEETETMSTPPAIHDRPPLNQILFGPPGTGKTYHSIDAALAVLDPDWLAANPGPTGRNALKQRFDELLQARRIRFVTFHQSFSYEDFVEGLRADNDEDGNLRYRVESGVFKSLCDDARGAAQVAYAVGIRDGARIWKISIEGTGASVTRDYGFKHGQARIGWGEVGDLHDEHLADRAEYQKLGSNDRNTLHAFSSEIQPGDVMLCIGSATQAQAIGVVQGDYRFEANVPSGVRTDFNNVLPVRWLATGLTLNLRDLNGGIRFTLKTVYELSRFGWPELAEAIEAADIKLGGASGAPARRPLDHVLIIDEINRGNVSRIFGELITLIEASKRAGADEQLEVVLPYSKKSFAVPDNVYLIGTMNTADRSLMGLDIALRRRFEFVEMPALPGLLAGVVVDGIDIEAMLTVMNRRIEVLLDRDHHLGHAYFMPLIADPSLKRLGAIFQNQILPLLQEYFFEDWERIRWVLNDQHKKGAGHSFVVPPQHSVPGLFGGTSEVPVDARLWELDPTALGRRESYLGIIDAGAIGTNGG